MRLYTFEIMCVCVSQYQCWFFNRFVPHFIFLSCVVLFWHLIQCSRLYEDSCYNSNKYTPNTYVQFNSFQNNYFFCQKRNKYMRHEKRKKKKKERILFWIWKNVWASVGFLRFNVLLTAFNVPLLSCSLIGAHCFKQKENEYWNFAVRFFSSSFCYSFRRYHLSGHHVNAFVNFIIHWMAILNL